MTDPAPTPTRRMPTGLRILLFVSLALNLAVGGVVIGAQLRPDRMLMRADADTIGHAIFRSLPPADRRALRSALRQTVDREQMRDARIGPDLVGALRADPFDIDTVQRLIDRQQGALIASRAVMRDAWFARISEMTRAERLEYADRIAEAMRRRTRKGQDPAG